MMKFALIVVVVQVALSKVKAECEITDTHEHDFGSVNPGILEELHIMEPKGLENIPIEVKFRNAGAEFKGSVRAVYDDLSGIFIQSVLSDVDISLDGKTLKLFHNISIPEKKINSGNQLSTTTAFQVAIIFASVFLNCNLKISNFSSNRNVPGFLVIMILVPLFFGLISASCLTKLEITITMPKDTEKYFFHEEKSTLFKAVSDPMEAIRYRYKLYDASSVPGRRLVVRNSCPYHVRVGMTAGAFDKNSMAVCPDGTFLYNNRCFFKELPIQNGTSKSLNHGEYTIYALDAFPTVTYEDKKTKTNISAEWNGNIWGQTGCTANSTVGLSCETGLCYDGADLRNVGHCKIFEGPWGPVTKAEFTIQDGSADVYDVSTIDGLNLAMGIKPLNSYTAAESYGVNGWRGKSYWCGYPGYQAQKVDGNLTGSTWQYNYTKWSTDFNLKMATTWVANEQALRCSTINQTCYDNYLNGIDCSDDSDCNSTEGHVCGIMLKVGYHEPNIPGSPGAWAAGGNNGLWVGKCGRKLGLISPNKACDTAIADGKNPAIYGCKNSITITEPVTENLTLYALYSCQNPLVSGYSMVDEINKVLPVCGCANWTDYGIPAPYNGAGCQRFLPEWIEYSLTPWLQLFKSASPTTYTYPFDDESATFQCSTKNETSNNTQSYMVEFCPDGATSLEAIE